MNPVEGIIARLTEGERAALLAFPPENPWLDEYSKPPWPGLHLRADLGALGEMRPGAVFNHAFRLTPLGLAVKAALEDPSHAD